MIHVTSQEIHDGAGAAPLMVEVAKEEAEKQMARMVEVVAKVVAAARVVVRTVEAVAKV